MPEVHHTAIIEGEVELADDVRVGPHCVITGPVSIGAGSQLVGNVYVNGPAKFGTGNTLYPFVCLGFAPQHARFDRTQPGRGLEVGDDNTFREHVSIHRAFLPDGPTRIGHRNQFMANSHAGHDSVIGDDNTFTNGVLLAGHVVIGSRVTVGGIAGIHQFCRVGDLAMVGGGSRIARDIPPYFMVTAPDVCVGTNRIGLRRAGFSSEDRELIKWVYRTLYREGHTIAQAVEILRERSELPIVERYLTFIDAAERGLVRGSRVERGVKART